MSGEESGSDSGSETEIEDEIIEVIEEITEVDDHQNEEEDDEAITEEVSKIDWKKQLPGQWSQKKRKKKDTPRKLCELQFKPSSILDCFNQFMTIEMKEIILKYTNMEGKFIVLLFSNPYLLGGRQ